MPNASGGASERSAAQQEWRNQKRDQRSDKHLVCVKITAQMFGSFDYYCEYCILKKVDI